MPDDTDIHQTSAAQPGNDTSPFQVALEHAVRWWNAEEENARRLMSRERLLLTIGLALASLSAVKGVKAVGEVLSMPHGIRNPGSWFVIFLVLGATLAFWGISYAAGG